MKQFFGLLKDAFVSDFSALFSALRRGPLRSKEPVDPILESMRKGICPDCGGTTFFMGPHGGMSQNVECSNKSCGSRFNLAPFEDGWLGTAILAERIGKRESATTNN